MVLGLDAPRRRDGDLRRHALRGAARRPLRTVGAVLETAFHPARSGPQPPARVLPRRRASRCPAPTRCSSRSGLADAGNRRAGGYSLGMRQRLALATALLGDPAVLVLDEPANGLDPEGIQWLRGFLRHLAHEQGRTVLVSSHLLSEVEQTVDRVVIVGAGRLVREGSMEQLRSGADGAGTVLVRGPEMGRLADVLRAAGTSVSPGRRRPSPSPAAPRPRSATAPSPPASSCTSCAPHTSGLEEIYFQLTSGSGAVRRPVPRHARHPGGHPMIHLVRAEWTKLFTTRVWIGLLLGACVMVGGFAALFTGLAGQEQNGQPGIPAGRHASSTRRSPSPWPPTPACCC